nr:MAG TPA: ATPase [Caudoviricetes sp.]
MLGLPCLAIRFNLPDVLPVWCRLWGSNPRPPDYKSGALPA